MGTREAIKTYFKKLDSGVFARNWNAMTGRGYTGVVPATVPPTAQIYNFNGSSRESRDAIDENFRTATAMMSKREGHEQPYQKKEKKPSKLKYLLLIPAVLASWGISKLIPVEHYKPVSPAAIKTSIENCKNPGCVWEQIHDSEAIRSDYGSELSNEKIKEYIEAEKLGETVLREMDRKYQQENHLPEIMRDEK